MNRICYITILLLMGVSVPLWGFTSLRQAQAYADALAKGNRTSFNANQFKQLLSEVTNHRESIGYSGKFLLKITPYPQTEFVIWGPLKGSFSSLVRTLIYGKNLGTIADDFTIIRPSTYVVFNGDVINSSETSLETLALVLALMRANPKKIFYLKGEAESSLHWQNDSLKKALQAKAKALSDEKIPLGKKVEQFFSTLPLALYITGLNPAEGVLRISYFSREFDEIDETNCKALTSRSINVPQICYLDTPHKSKVQVKALIKAEQRLMSYQHHPGLTLVEPERGAVTWSIFSGPSKRYQQEYQFFNDAYSVLTTGTSLKDATITLYATDARTEAPISYAGTYNLLTGVLLPELIATKRKTTTLPILQQELAALYKKIDTLTKRASHLSQAIDLYKENGS